MKKVLIVEDNRSLSELLKMRLEKEGFSVDVVGSGLSLLSYLKARDEPDAVILDLFIPEKSGIELLDTLVNTWQKSFIFIYSAQVRWKAQCMRYPGVCRFFSKTDDMQDVVAAIKEKIGTSQSGG